MKKNNMNGKIRKALRETFGDGVKISVTPDDYEKNKQQLKAAVGDKGTITLSNSGTGKIGESEDFTFDDSDVANRGIEYGINGYDGGEDFEEVMNRLKKSGDSPLIEIKEDIKPRIMKKDLINHLKTKKNGKTK